MTNPEQKYGKKYADDFPWNLATEGIIYFPKNVITKESVQDNLDGRLFTFELDSEKYYTYRFPMTAEE